jgi:tetratricopeptide (TPR) repeat protein
MPNIDLKTAIRMIYQIVYQSHNRNSRSPFFFIAGAGVSNPPIPLAWEIEEQCKQVAQNYDDTNPPELKTTMDSYSHWMGKAYPSPKALQSYLRDLMGNKPISKANLRLAHLLIDGRLARTVFTPNFDDLLAKALELFGQRPLVCDHPLTVGRIRIESEDIQIVHVHGSYWFYDCCNLKQEIAGRSGYGPMSVLLDQSLWDHSPLVVGYSGWDGDVLMSALKRRLSNGKLGTPAFWFCYKRESLDALPDWLTQSSDVIFVLPDDPSPATSTSSTTQPPEPKIQASLRAGSITGIGDSSFDAKAASLPADRVLDSLVRKFEPPAPPLTQNPLAFYAKHLRDLLGTSGPEGEQDTYYGFHKVIARVERARDSEVTEEPDLLQGFRDAMSKANYRGAIKSANEIDLDKLSPKKCNELVFALVDASLGLNDNSDDEIAGYDLVVRAADLLAHVGSADLRLQEQVAKALGRKCKALVVLGKIDDALTTCNQVASRFNEAKEQQIREQVAGALVCKSFCLLTLNRAQDSIAACDEVARHFDNPKEPVLRESVAMALVNKGVALGTLGRSKEAIAVYDDVVRRFSNAREPALRNKAARALFNKGFTLETLRRSEEAITVYNDVVRRFSNAMEPALRELVAEALVNKGATLEFLGRNEEAIAVYDDAVNRFADAREPALRELVAMVRVNKGVTLETLGRNEEAITVYDDVVRRFEDAREPALREQSAKALLLMGMTYESSGKKEAAFASYEEVLARFGGDEGSEIDVLLNQARNKRDKLRSEGASQD